MTHELNGDLPPRVKVVLEARQSGSASEIVKATEDLHHFGDPKECYPQALYQSPGERFRRRVARTLFELMKSPTCPLIHEPKNGNHVFVQIEATAEAILQDLEACGMLSETYESSEDLVKSHPGLINDHRHQVISALKVIILDRQSNQQSASSYTKLTSV